MILSDSYNVHVYSTVLFGEFFVHVLRLNLYMSDGKCIFCIEVTTLITQKPLQINLLLKSLYLKLKTA